jgi:hypothetical protein
MKNGWQIPLVALVLVVLFAAFIAKPMASAADIAAWVQGVGSLLAIGAAVWIYAKQYQDKKADDLAETRAFIQSIHTELSALWGGYSRNMRPKLQGDIQERGFIYHVFPASPDALLVYNSTVARVGKVDDAGLRELIVQSYARFRGMIYSLQLNNALVNDLAQFEILYRADDREKRLEQKIGVLRDYATQLKQGDADIEGLLTRLLPMMEKWLADHTVTN